MKKKKGGVQRQKKPVSDISNPQRGGVGDGGSVTKPTWPQCLPRKRKAAGRTIKKGPEEKKKGKIIFLKASVRVPSETYPLSLSFYPLGSLFFGACRTGGGRDNARERREIRY